MSPNVMKEIEIFGEVAEAKRIFSAIENSFAKYTSPCIVITSASPGEGKSFLAAGLAAVAAGRRSRGVLAMDFNWYKPTLHHYFGLDQTFDMEDFKSEQEVMNLARPSGLENLKIVTAPRLDEDASIASDAIDAAEIIGQVRESNDVVIMDTSSIFPTNRWMIDPTVIAEAADGAALVGLANKTRLQDMKKARVTLEKSGANVIGLVINQWKGAADKAPEVKR